MLYTKGNTFEQIEGGGGGGEVGGVRAVRSGASGEGGEEFTFPISSSCDRIEYQLSQEDTKDSSYILRSLS